MIIFKCA